MKVFLTLASLCISLTVAQVQISSSPNLQTLSIAGLNPSLALAFQSVLENKYRPNPNPFTNSFVCLILIHFPFINP